MTKTEIPKLLLKLDFMLKSVAFIAIFSVMFMIIYAPFSLSGWFDIFSGSHLQPTVLFYIVAIIVMIVSKIAMANICRRIVVTPVIYILWLLGEIIVISMLYTFFTVWLAYDGGFDNVYYLFVRAFCCSGAILAIPYVILALYAAYKSKEEENEFIRHHARRYGAEADGARLVNLCDGNGDVKLTIDVDSLYYIESQDNYVKIYYENGEVLQHYMLRCRTSSVEEALAGTTMVRCHRSYIINTSKIKLLDSDRSSHSVSLKHPNIGPIPVSKSYYGKLMSAIAADRQPR